VAFCKGENPEPIIGYWLKLVIGFGNRLIRFVITSAYSDRKMANQQAKARIRVD